MPFPLQGHINPFLTLVKLLIPHGFTFTFVIAEELAGSLPKIPNAGQEKQEEEEEEEEEGEGESEPIPPPPIRYVSLPVISLDEAARRVGNNGSLRLQHLEVVKSMRPGLEDLLRYGVGTFGRVVYHWRLLCDLAQRSRAPIQGSHVHLLYHELACYVYFPSHRGARRMWGLSDFWYL